MDNMDHLYKKLIEILSEDNVIVNHPLKSYTYTRLGGDADLFVMPDTYEQVQAVVKLASNENIAFTLLGNGSNLIIKDGGIRGIVMYLGNLNEIKIDGTKVTAQSGAKIINVSREAYTEELTGLEFACGIPGSVGGALFMNAGAYGGEVKDVLESTRIVDKHGELHVVLARDLDLAYRTSNISDNDYIVLDATFGLEKRNPEEIKAIMDDLTFKRESKQPLEYPSCGSVFKRPPGNFAGKLIQESGLQGKMIGGAQVSLKHAGFIVNKDSCTAQEYLDLIKFVQQTVKEKYGITLEREVRVIGEDL